MSVVIYFEYGIERKGYFFLGGSLLGSCVAPINAADGLVGAALWASLRVCVDRVQLPPPRQDIAGENTHSYSLVLMAHQLYKILRGNILTRAHSY